jgi:hypothetical protein
VVDKISLADLERVGRSGSPQAAWARQEYCRRTGFEVGVTPRTITEPEFHSVQGMKQTQFDDEDSEVNF